MITLKMTSTVFNTNHRTFTDIKKTVEVWFVDLFWDCNQLLGGTKI